MFLTRQMNKKIYRVIGLVELALLPFLVNYTPQKTLNSNMQQPSALERILKKDKQEAQSRTEGMYNQQTRGYAQDSYARNIKEYIQKHIEEKEDMTNRVPLKWLNILPESQMGGVLGFTYLGENFMGRRADLAGAAARMVDIHESIHTPDEYETRVLTEWIMEKVRGKYVK